MVRPFALPSLTLVLAVLVLQAPRSATAQTTVVLLPVRGEGASDDALRSATTSLRRNLEVRGLRIEVNPGDIPSGDADPAELAELARRRGAAMLVDPVLQEFAGTMSLRIRVISSDGRVLGEHAILASAATLPQDASRALADAMREIPAGVGSEGAVAPPWDLPERQVTEPVETPRSGGAEIRGERRRQLQGRPPQRRRRWHQRMWWLGAMIEPAMGTNRSAFNLMTGVRAELNWRGLTVSANLDYVYIIDWEPRSDPDYHTIGVFGLVGYQIRLGSDRLFLPLMVGGGYLPGNGGLLRIEAGLAIKPIDRLDIRVTFVCPNFWFLGEEMVLFTSLSLSLLVGF
jgi:hypothetical protein